ncbi:unnamed protein product, partial [marine sediment metagenome]
NDTVLVIISGTQVEKSEIFEKYIFKKIDKEFNNSIFPLENSYLYLFDKTSVLNSSKLLYKIDYSNFDEFWKPLSQCNLDIEDNKVWIKVYGEDPYFESLFPIEFKNNNPLMIVVNIDSFVDAKFQIYYGRKGKGYNEGDSSVFSVIKGENNIYIGIPYSEDLERIRIDPINVKSDCSIKKIEIYSMED